MKNNLFKVCSLLIFITLTSCSYPIYSPSINVENASKDKIKVTKFSWNGYRLNEGYYYGYIPGQSAGQSFILQKRSHLYGPIRIEWLNAKKEKIVKEIEFTRDHLPDFDQKKLPFVNFYLTQDDLKMFVAPHGILFANEEERQISKQAAQFERDYKATHSDYCFNAYGCVNKKLTSKEKSEKKSFQ